MTRRLSHSLSVRAKLVAGFGAVSALLVLTLVVSLLALDRQHSATRTLAERNALQVQAADDVSKAASDLAAWEAANALGGGDQTGDLDGAISEFRDALRTLSARAANPEQVSLVTKIRTQFTAYLALDGLIRSSLASGATGRARELALGPVLLDYGNISEDAGTFAEVARQAEAAQVAAADGIASSARWILVALAAVALALAALVATAVSRGILGRTRELLEAAEAVAHGDLTRTVEPSPDELGRLAAAFNAMVGALSSLVREIDTVSDGLVVTSSRLASGSDETHRAVAEISRAIEDMASGTEKQVELVSQTRANAGGVVDAARTSSASAADTAEDAATARRLAAEGVEAAEQARVSMASLAESSSQLTSAMAQFTTKSEQIGGIVETITGIAGQTNLLALNAAIEAARAGEQGRGFAVVAEEVRKLAEESQQAAATISGLVDEIQAETERTVTVVEQGVQQTAESSETVEAARDAFSRIGTAVQGMRERIDQIVEATGDVAAVAAQSSASTEQVSASTEETSASAQEIAASAQELARTAEELDGLVGRFRLATA
ncbi:MAG TPA: HAMP domain-containing methyl-accepting chemotaxis protein [Gaiellaceae bacterium]